MNGTPEGSLQIAHYEPPPTGPTGWVLQPRYDGNPIPPGSDTNANTVCASVDHLSQFALVTPVTATITVTKTYSDLSTTAVAGITLSCPLSGAIITPLATQDITGVGSAVFTVTGFSSGSSCSAAESSVPSGYVQASNDCTAANLPLSAGVPKGCTISNNALVPHDAVMSKLDTGSKDIHLGATGIKVRDVKAHCLNKTAGGDTIRCTVQIAGLPSGCTAQSSGHDKLFGTGDDGPVLSGGPVFVLDGTSSYTLNQDRNFDFKVKIACAPPITSPTFPAIVMFEGCADGGNIDRNNPCSDSDDTHSADNVRVRFNRLLK